MLHGINELLGLGAVCCVSSRDYSEPFLGTKAHIAVFSTPRELKA